MVADLGHGAAERNRKRAKGQVRWPVPSNAIAALPYIQSLNMSSSRVNLPALGEIDGTSHVRRVRIG
jgi:hypothetical protein